MERPEQRCFPAFVYVNFYVADLTSELKTYIYLQPEPVRFSSIREINIMELEQKGTTEAVEPSVSANGRKLGQLDPIG